MPLLKGKSQKAFSHNVGVEMDAGKDQKQALAIAYAMKRRAGGKSYSQGGTIPGGGGDSTDGQGVADAVYCKMCGGGQAYAKGGEVIDDPSPLDGIDDTDDDFLSDEDDSSEGEEMNKGGLLEAVVKSVRSKNFKR